MKKLIFGSVLVKFNNYSVFCLAIFIIINLFIQVYLVFIKPFKNKYLGIVEYVNELLFMIKYGFILGLVLL